ncbi:VOC family protein [Rummeliibacillus sp. TYF005]|uniref:VOC family protein n=1 Tax=unclassified Rummeliibacillus TaxID=2622809 RepID=UPI000E6686E7|nr:MULTISPECIES: VOC family protein [unclassified Rummeliibacillus]RIJ62923.1 VOC family protein [Rummeliibacillus sp. POC4]RPJ95083.1 VOC family protein [Rummeliibacillus sp. TYF005]
MFELDHVVYFTKKAPVDIAKDITIEGIQPVVGGRHLQWGTFNALFYTKNSYIEWLAVEDSTIAKRSTHPLVQQLLYDIDDGEGYKALCLRSENLEESDRYIRKLGYRTTGIIPAERKTADGQIIRWKMLFIKHKLGDSLPYPFFIEWEHSFEERQKMLKADGTIQKGNEEIRIERCVFQVKDVQQKLIQWSRLLSLPITGNTLRLKNTIFSFQKLPEGKERLQTIDIVKV